MIRSVYKGAGDCYTVAHCSGALKSLSLAMKSVSPAKKQRSMQISLQLQIERLASGKRTADLSVRKEGVLPSYKGRPPKTFGP